MSAPPITQIAINGVIYPELLAIASNKHKATQVDAGESLFVTWWMTGQQRIESLLALQNTTVALSLLFANNNWVNNVLATFTLTQGKAPRLTLSGAPLGRIILGRWNENLVEDPYGETMTAQLQLQTPLPLFAPKIVAVFY